MFNHQRVYPIHNPLTSIKSLFLVPLNTIISQLSVKLPEGIAVPAVPVICKLQAEESGWISAQEMGCPSALSCRWIFDSMIFQIYPNISKTDMFQWGCNFGFRSWSWPSPYYLCVRTSSGTAIIKYLQSWMRIHWIGHALFSQCGLVQNAISIIPLVHDNHHHPPHPPHLTTVSSSSSSLTSSSSSSS